MKITNIPIYLIFLLILLISYPIFPTNHFVDKNASGQNNGTSWSNAWESLSSINWSVVNPGDTIWIAGRTYNETLNIGKSGSAGKIIVITGASEPGYNREAIIDGQNSRSYCVNASSKNYFKINNITLKNATTAALKINGSYNCFSHLKLYNTGCEYLLNLRGSYDSLIYCNGYSTSTPAPGTSFGGNGDFAQTTTGGHHYFAYDSIWVADANTSHHTDCLQFYGMDNDVLIENCYFEHTDTKTTNAQFIYMTTSNIRLTVRNCVFVAPYAKNGVAINNTSSYHGSATVENNTFYQGSGATQFIIQFVNGDGSQIDTVLNNIIYTAASINCARYDNSGKNVIDHNIYYTRGSYPVYYGSGKTWSAWQSLGYDAHGYNTNPLFTNAPGQLTIKSNSTAINKGINLSRSFSTDFYGNERGSNWDIGAYQFSTSTTSNGVVVNTKIILSGAFNGTSMATDLYDKGYIPLSQPYNLSPWNYNGTEKVTSIPPKTVDWILIELRNSTTSSSIIARRAAFLKSDGTITDLDGSSPVLFSTVAPGYYYIVIIHRNHLSVMSANKVNLNMNSSDYNFTDSETKAYGTNAMEDLGNGKFGLYSGDANGDGTVAQNDILNVWLNQFLNSKDGYQSADFNLDGSVTASDNNIFWLINNGKTSQVPN